jgi:hypothetical protein
MSAVIEFHDSKFLWLDVQGGTVTVRIAAVVHRSDGQPGKDAGSVWQQEVEIVVLDSAAPERPLQPHNLSDGTLSVGSASFVNVVPLPFQCDGEVLLELVAEEKTIVVSGTAISVRGVGEARYVEEFPG